jgi:hypothetical protein
MSSIIGLVFFGCQVLFFKRLSSPLMNTLKCREHFERMFYMRPVGHSAGLRGVNKREFFCAPAAHSMKQFFFLFACSNLMQAIYSRLEHSRIAFSRVCHISG